MDSKMNRFLIFAVLISILTLISFYINNNSISVRESFDLGETSINNNEPAIEPLNINYDIQRAIREMNAKVAADKKKLEDAKAATDKVIADAKAAANKVIADAKAAAEKAAKAAADKKAAEEKAAADKAAADKKAAEEKAAAKVAADKKAAEEKAAAQAKEKAAADKKEADRVANKAYDALTKSVTVNDYYNNLPQAFIKNTIADYLDISKAPKTNPYVILYDFYVNKAGPAIQKGQSSSSAETVAVIKKFTTLFNNGNPSPPIELYAFLDNVDVINFFKLDFMKSTVNDLVNTLNDANNSSNAGYKMPLEVMIKIFTYVKNKIAISESIDAINKSVTVNEFSASVFMAFLRIFMSKYQEISKAPKTDPYVVLTGYYQGKFSSEVQKFEASASTEEKATVKKFADLFNNGNPNPPVELYAFLDKPEIVNFINTNVLKNAITDFLSILNDLNDSSKSTYDADYKVPVNAVIKIFTYMKGKIRNPTTTPMSTTTTYAPTTTPRQMAAPTALVPSASVLPAASTALVPSASVLPAASTVSVPGASVLPAAPTVPVPGASVFPAVASGSVRSLAALSSTVSVPVPVPAAPRVFPMASVSMDQSSAGDLSTYNLIKSQNAQLSNMITSSSNENSKHYQKSVYQNGDINLLNTINNYLFIFYYLIVLILVYFLYIDKEYSIYKKAIVLALFAGYPYLANLIKYYVAKFFVYIYSFVNVIVYETEGW